MTEKIGPVKKRRKKVPPPPLVTNSGSVDNFCEDCTLKIREIAHYQFVDEKNRLVEPLCKKCFDFRMKHKELKGVLPKKPKPPSGGVLGLPKPKPVNAVCNIWSKCAELEQRLDVQEIELQKVRDALIMVLEKEDPK